MQIEYSKLQELSNDQNWWGREEGTGETSKEGRDECGPEAGCAEPGDLGKF